MPAAPPLSRLLMVGFRGHSVSDPALHDDLAALRDCAVSGVILFDVDLPALSEIEARGVSRPDAIPRATRNIISREQTRALAVTLREALGDDLLIAVDQEGGAPPRGISRLTPERGFAPTLAAADVARLDHESRNAEAAKLADVVASAGANINFAPCVDVALNPDNPVIAQRARSYSADPRLVAACAAAVIDAHNAARVATCLKHFPGHGSSTADSHDGFTDITATHQPKAELFPYELLLRLPPPESRAPMVMTGHLFDARIDPDHPASLSRAHTTGILRERLGFEGVIVVDSLDMRAVTDRYAPDEAIIRALNAGADMILDCNNSPGPARPCPAPAILETIERALRNGRIEGGEARLLESIRRIDRLRRRVESPAARPPRAPAAR